MIHKKKRKKKRPLKEDLVGGVPYYGYSIIYPQVPYYGYKRNKKHSNLTRTILLLAIGITVIIIVM